MAEREVIVLCYWNGCIKYGPDGVYYAGSNHRKMSVKQKTEFSRLVDGIYLITGFDKKKSKLDIIGRYPVVVSNLLRYIHLPVVNDTSLETMLEVPTIHPSINSVELYLEVKPTCNDVMNPASCSSPPLENSGSSLKRQRTQQPREADGYVDTNVTHPAVVKLERDNGLEVQGVDNNYGEANADFGNGCSHGAVVDKSSGSDGVTQAVNLTADSANADKDLNVPGLKASANTCLNKGVGSEPLSLSNLWVDDHELRVGLCFKDRDELKKAVDWCSIRGQQKCLVHETKKDEYAFECFRSKCNWSLCAAKMEEHGLVEITKFIGPHTCSPTSIGPDQFDLEFAAEEIECLIRVQPTLTIDELNNWWFEKYCYRLAKFGYDFVTAEMQDVKDKAIKKIYGDWDQSFRLLPKLMAALHSSNGLLVDWQYDRSPNPEFASFSGVFWAFPQSIEGFKHCRPLIEVYTKDLNDKYPVKLMIAYGADAVSNYFPLAFAVTKELSSDSWRWFLTGIREKVTQRKELCLITSPDPDILTVINEPGSLWKEPWAYHMFSLNDLCSEFYDIFRNDYLRDRVRQTGSAMQQDVFDSLMENIKKENPEARRWLDQMPPHKWALAHDGGRRYGTIRTSIEKKMSGGKSFQSGGMTVTAFALLMFDELRTNFHQGLCDSRSWLNQGNMYTKPVMDKLEEFRRAYVTYVVMPLDNNAFKVTTCYHKDGWIVQLSECACTCGEFQENKFPCLHALAVCDKLKINPLQYVDECYSLERYYKTYSAKFVPVPEVSTWPEFPGVPTLLPPVIPPTPPPNVELILAERRRRAEGKMF